MPIKKQKRKENTKQEAEYSDKCCFSISFNNAEFEDNSNTGKPFCILEHTELDDFEYRNGMFCFTLNEKKLKDMATSFKKNVVGRDLCINYDHEANGSTIAAGWINDVKVEKTENGYGLFASAEWSPRAKEHILHKEYKYFSAECKIEGMTLKWSDGELAYDPKIKKSILEGGALTNNPFFKTTNLELNNNNKGDEDMADYAELNAEFEQLKLDSKNQIDKLKADFESEKQKNVELNNKIIEFENKTKEGLINSMIKELPETKHEEIKVKLSKLNIEQLNEFGGDIVKAADDRPKINGVADLNLNFNKIEIENDKEQEEINALNKGAMDLLYKK